MNYEKHIEKLKELNFNISFITNKFVQRYENNINERITVLSVPIMQRYLDLIANTLHCGLIKAGLHYDFLVTIADKKGLLVHYNELFRDDCIDFSYVCENSEETIKAKVPVYFIEEFWEMFDNYYGRIEDREGFDLVAYGLKEMSFEDEKIHKILTDLSLEID